MKDAYGNEVEEEEKPDALQQRFAPKAKPPPPMQPMPAPQQTQTNVGTAAAPPPQAAPVAPPAQPAPQPQQRQQPTNFTNFARRFGANRDDAKAQADRFSAQAIEAQKKAADSLAASKAKFGDPAGDRAAIYKRLEELRANVYGDGFSPTREADAKEMVALGKKLETYDGPKGLDTTQALADAESATQQTDALASEGGIQSLINEGQSGSRGADIFGAALTGAAGRNDFDALRGRFNPNKEILDAQKKATADAGESQADADRLSTEAERRRVDRANRPPEEAPLPAQDSAKAPAPTPSWKDRNNPMAYVSDPRDQKAVTAEMEKMGQWGQAQQHDAGDDLRSVVRDLSPVDHIWQAATGGEKSPLDKEFSELNYGIHKNGEQGSFGGNYKGGQGGGNESGGKGEHIYWGPNDYVVFRQMDDAQWKKLQSLGKQGQIDWINTRRNQLAPDWKKDLAQAQLQSAPGML